MAFDLYFMEKIIFHMQCFSELFGGILKVLTEVFGGGKI